jgi:hypothetical protein
MKESKRVSYASKVKELSHSEISLQRKDTILDLVQDIPQEIPHVLFLIFYRAHSDAVLSLPQASSQYCHTISLSLSVPA